MLAAVPSGEEELVLNERAVNQLQRIVAQRLFIFTPAITIHDFSVAQLVVVPGLKLNEIKNATSKLCGRLNTVLFLHRVAVEAVLAVDLSRVAEFA